MIITKEQIRAGRALIGWKQKQMAAAAGISLRTYNLIDLGLTTPREETMRALKEALEKESVEFLPNQGVRLKMERLDVEIIDSTDAFEQLHRYVIDELKDTGGEVLFHSIDERSFLAIDPKIMDNYFFSCHTYKIDERILVLEKDNLFLNHPNKYRWLREQDFLLLPYVVFGDAVAFYFMRPLLRFVIIRNPQLALSFRALFEKAWVNSLLPALPAPVPARNDAEPWSTARSEKIRALLQGGDGT